MSGYARVSQEDHPPSSRPVAPGVTSAASPTASPSFFSSLFSSSARQDPAAAAASCADSLRSAYGPHVPGFQALGFDEAMVLGQRTSRPVLVYLQSDLHTDTEDFLRSTLCTAEVCEVVRSVGYVAWAGRVHEPSGWEASLKLEATGFPFLAVFMPQASSGARGPSTRSVRVWAMEGSPVPSSAALATDLRRWGAQARGVLEEDSAGRRAQERARNVEREMRENQEREYQAAEAADAARARAAQAEERARAAAAAREAEAAAAAAAAAAEAEDARELQLAMQLSLRSDAEEGLAAARARLAASPEPSLGAAVRIQLPSGTKLQRRFPPAAPLALLVDYVVVSSGELGQGLDPGTFDLATTHPRRTFNVHSGSAAEGSQAGVTLEQAGLAGAVVLVQKVAGR